MKKVYDTFCFFNELDILELRLNILDPVVDYFVICESSVTHTGVIKPFYFEENKKRYEKFLHKIIHLKIEDTPNDFINLPKIENISTADDICVLQIYKFIETQTNRFNRATEVHYGRDFFQKESVRRGLVNCDDNDLIMFSDCDEIPNPDLIPKCKELLEENSFLSFSQICYYYFINMLKEHDWKGTRIGKYKDLKNYSYNELRANDWIVLPNGGWHFSYMGGSDKVKTKINSFSAQEMNNPYVIQNIEFNINNGIDPFFRSRLSTVNIDNSYPKYLLDNLEKYKYLIK